MILGLSLKDKLEPTIDLLEKVLVSTIDEVIQQRLTGSTLPPYSCVSKKSGSKINGRERLRKCISRHPQILALSYENLRTKIDYFNELEYASYQTLGNNTKESNEKRVPISLSARIGITVPSVYSLSLMDNILPTVEYLGALWGSRVPHIVKNLLVGKSDHVSDEASCCFSQLIGEYPAVLTLSLEGNIIPTLGFYNRTGYIDLDDSANGKNTHLRGRYIATSLFNRLLPRYSYCDEVNTALCREGGPPLHLLAGANDSEFCEQMGFSLDHFVSYKLKMTSALKFRSQVRLGLISTVMSTIFSDLILTSACFCAQHT